MVSGAAVVLAAVSPPRPPAPREAVRPVRVDAGVFVAEGAPRPAVSPDRPVPSVGAAVCAVVPPSFRPPVLPPRVNPPPGVTVGVTVGLTVAWGVEDERLKPVPPPIRVDAALGAAARQEEHTQF